MGGQDTLSPSEAKMVAANILDQTANLFTEATVNRGLKSNFTYKSPV